MNKVLILSLISSILFSCSSYEGSSWNSEPASVPGRILLVEYDKGGEGIAYHDKDELNKGVYSKSGDGDNLGFRKGEGVDTKHCKEYDFHVNGEPMNRDILYIGWNVPGEWRRYTIKVAEDAYYTIHGTFSMALDGPAFELQFSDGTKSGAINIPSTGHYHKWAFHKNLGKIYLSKGEKVMTLKVLGKGMNFHDMHFEKIN